MTPADTNSLRACPSCKKPPGSKVGPPALVRCVTDGCPGRGLAAETPAQWNTRATSEPVAGTVREITDAMCAAAIDIEWGSRSIQGFSYEKRHVIRNVSLPPEQQEIWSAPVAGPDEYETFQRQCRIERMRVVLGAALSTVSPQAGATTASAPEPVAWRYKDTYETEWHFNDEKSENEWDIVEPLYATPPAPGAADRTAVIEECAKFVEQHQETNRETSNGSERYLAPRKVGNLMGIAYVDGLRALAVPRADGGAK